MIAKTTLRLACLAIILSVTYAATPSNIQPTPCPPGASIAVKRNVCNANINKCRTGLTLPSCSLCSLAGGIGALLAALAAFLVYLLTILVSVSVALLNGLFIFIISLVNCVIDFVNGLLGLAAFLLKIAALLVTVLKLSLIGSISTHISTIYQCAYSVTPPPISG